VRAFKARRLITQILHWVTGVLLYLLLSVDDRIFGALGWSFVVSGGALCLLWPGFGLLNKGPGPALQGVLRKAHPWSSRGMYLLLGWSVVALAAGALERPLPGPEARTVLLILGAAALFHAIFHLWRHTALRDGALRRIVPATFHKYL
jgi:cytochrome b561